MGCAELGVVGDGTSISVGRPNKGQVLDGVRLPDRGEGFVTREVWKTRGQRYGTDELVDLIVGVSRRMARGNEPRLVVADLSGQGGGEAHLWHRSHQSGRDVDLLYFMRKDGQPYEADLMRVFGDDGIATDGSGISIDVPRTWWLVKELVTAHEASVQWVFMYEPIAQRLLEHAIATNEPEAILVRARKAMRQPGDSARHDDHMHVRVYCTDPDARYGCVDTGPMDLAAERATQLAATRGGLAPIWAATFGATHAISQSPVLPRAAASVISTASPTTELRAFGRLLRSHPVLRPR
jgi:penicillin-insensitive murein endopeptidase